MKKNNIFLLLLLWSHHLPVSKTDALVILNENKIAPTNPTLIRQMLTPLGIMYQINLLVLHAHK